jgi:uncharacterized delta-60 repeat protein
MSPLPSRLRRLCLTAFFVASSMVARSVTLGPAGAPGAEPVRCSMAIVESQPAVAWADVKNGTVKYVRALDATGSSWGAPLTLDTGSFLPDLCLRTVNGNPAVCYFDDTLHRLKFARAADATGASWNPPVTFDGGLVSGGITMEVANGNPAIAFPTQTAGLKYMRALDASGSAWGAASTLDTLTSAGNPSMKLVEGHPAIAWPARFGFEVAYIRAADISGATWGAPGSIRFSPAFGATTYCSLQIIEGRPAVGFSAGDAFSTIRPEGARILFARSRDTTGTSWPVEATVVVNETDALLRYPSLEAINGKPAIAFFEGSPFFDLKLVQATDASGSVWQSPLTLDSTGGTGDYPSLLTVAGVPAVVYFDSTPGSVKYLRASNVEGTLWPPDILAGRQGTTTTIPDGGTAVFATAAPGGTARFDFTLRNPNSSSGELNITGVTIDGPDAAEFSLIVPLVSPLAAGMVSGFTVQHAPLSQGKKTAVLHITSNAEEPHHLYDITLTNVAEPPVPGTRDPSFNPFVVKSVSSIVVQADGKIITAAGTLMARYHPDGSPDNSFFAPPLDSGIFSLAMQKDGRILIAGPFTRVAGEPRSGLARLHPDGSLDESFAPGTSGSVSCLLIQPDEKILIGTFDGTNSATSDLIRVHPDGSPDAAFTPRLRGGFVNALALQPVGKILVGGRFTEISGVPAKNIARLNPDGTRDTFSGDFAAAFDNDISEIAVQPDGRIIVAGYFGGGLVRVFPDGLRDGSASYIAESYFGVSGAALQANGKCVVNGIFKTFGGMPRPSLARMQPDGTVDADFRPFLFFPSSENTYSLQAVIQADGKVLISGPFTGVDDMTQPNFARLENDPAFSSLQTSGPSTLRWLRGGSAPEVRDVTFDLKPEGSPDWTRLGNGTRIPGGWELSGLTLLASGQIRAQGYAGNSVMESVIPILTPLESWRVQYFGTAANTGDAADDADPDHDSLTNFTEYAFGLSPVDRASNALPEFKHSGAAFTTTFTAPAGRDDVLYRAEWSPTMQPGTWAAIPDTGTAPAHVFTLSATAPRLFVRYTVKIR